MKMMLLKVGQAWGPDFDHICGIYTDLQELLKAIPRAKEMILPEDYLERNPDQREDPSENVFVEVYDTDSFIDLYDTKTFKFRRSYVLLDGPTWESYPKISSMIEAEGLS